MQNTPIFEENPPDNFKGIDIMRAVRSFDPCLPCGVHMYIGGGKVVEQLHTPADAGEALLRSAHVHELAITQSLVDLVAERTAGRRVVAVHVRVGRAVRGACPTRCSSASTCVTAGTAARGRRDAGVGRRTRRAGGAELDAASSRSSCVRERAACA